MFLSYVDKSMDLLLSDVKGNGTGAGISGAPARDVVMWGCGDLAI